MLISHYNMCMNYSLILPHECFVLKIPRCVASHRLCCALLHSVIQGWCLPPSPSMHAHDQAMAVFVLIIKVEPGKYSLLAVSLKTYLKLKVLLSTFVFISIFLLPKILIILFTWSKTQFSYWMGHMGFFLICLLFLSCGYLERFRKSVMFCRAFVILPIRCLTLIFYKWQITIYSS